MKHLPTVACLRIVQIKTVFIQDGESIVRIFNIDINDVFVIPFNVPQFNDSWVLRDWEPPPYRTTLNNPFAPRLTRS